MKSTFSISLILMMVLTAACSPKAAQPENADGSNALGVMRAEHMAVCLEKREYASKRREGTLERYCGCIFDKATRGLSPQAQKISAFYLYGETHDAFKDRLKTEPLNLEAMGDAIDAVAKAAGHCR